MESNRSGTYGNSDIWYAVWDSVTGWGELLNCGPNVNWGLDEESPCISPDGNKIYFSTWERPGGYGSWDIWVATWNSLSGEWGQPENLGPNVNQDGTEWSPFINLDGSKLYFSSNRYFYGLSVCEWEGDGWGEAVWLGETVNATGTEKYPSLTADSRILYFSRYITSDIRNIFVSYWTGTEWSTPLALSPDINYPGVSTSAPWIAPDGSKLYFVAYHRPGGMGGTDIWVSERIPIEKERHFINRETGTRSEEIETK